MRMLVARKRLAAGIRTADGAAAGRAVGREGGRTVTLRDQLLSLNTKVIRSLRFD